MISSTIIFHTNFSQVDVLCVDRASSLHSQHKAVRLVLPRFDSPALSYSRVVHERSRQTPGGGSYRKDKPLNLSPARQLQHVQLREDFCITIRHELSSKLDTLRLPRPGVQDTRPSSIDTARILREARRVVWLPIYRPRPPLARPAVAYSFRQLHTAGRR
jgi:hypothetical protein